jgi:hypothetical protein
MAGNALTAAMFSVGKGNTGVGKPTTTLSAIDKGITDVGTWASGIEAEKQKLKTDTAKKYREAELKAYENMPANETEKANMIRGLDSYKDQLYMNMKLVQNGNIASKDNLIFQENGKQSFDILSQVIKTYGEERDLTIKRAMGYTTEDGTVVPAVSGGVEGAIQDFNSRFGNSSHSKITFDEKGMANITFFETEIDKETDTRVLKRDGKGEPIVQKGMKSISVLAYQNPGTQRADRVYLDREAQAFIGKETALGQAYELLGKIDKGMVGGVTNDQRQKQKNQLEQLLNSAADSIITANPSAASILVDNGPLAERSQAINQMQAAELKSAAKAEGKVFDLDEKISYTYIDSDGVTQEGKKSKYILQKMSENNVLVSVLSDEDKQAAKNMAKSQLYSQLGRKVDAGTKVTTFDQNSASSRASNKIDRENQGTVDLIDQAATGNKNSLDALVAENSNVVSAYDISGTEGNLMLSFIDMDGNTLAPIPLSGLGKDAGKQIAAQLQLKAQIYNDKSTLKKEKATGKIGNYQTVTKDYKGLGNLDLGVTEVGGIKRAGTAAELFAETIKGDPDEDEVTGVANTIIQKAIKEYGLDSNVNVSFKNETGPFDKYVITLDGVDYDSPSASSSDNHVWLQKNMDRVLRGEKPQGKIAQGEGELDN